MQREVKKFLDDILHAGNLIREFTTGTTFEQYRLDVLVQSAVERQFEIIGEALHGVLQEDRSLESRITTPNLIIAFRNRLIHGYASVSSRVVWGVIEKHLPVLLNEIQALLAE